MKLAIREAIDSADGHDVFHVVLSIDGREVSRYLHTANTREAAETYAHGFHDGREDLSKGMVYALEGGDEHLSIPTAKGMGWWG